MKRPSLEMVGAALFALVAGVQVWKWGAMQLPVQGPVLLMAALGVLVGLTKEAWPFRNRALFVLAFASCFLLIWAAGRPGTFLVPGGTWWLTLLCLVVVGSVSIWSAGGGKGWVWALAFLGSVGFGLGIAYLSGPGGGPDAMTAWVRAVFGLGEEDWRVTSAIVFWMRKSIHFLGYGTAALLTAVAARRAGAGLRVCWVVAIVWPLSLAVFDETQQRFAANRTGQFSDVLIDLAGMVVFLGLWTWLLGRRGERSGMEGG